MTRVDRPSCLFLTRDTAIVEYIEADVDPHASVHLFVNSSGQASNYTSSGELVNDCVAQSALASIIGAILQDNIRYQKGLVYYFDVHTILGSEPYYQRGFNIEFSCPIEHRESLVADVRKVIHDMAYEDVITQELLDSFVKDQLIRNNNVDEVQKLTVDSLREYFANMLSKGCVTEASLVITRKTPRE